MQEAAARPQPRGGSAGGSGSGPYDFLPDEFPGLSVSGGVAAAKVANADFPALGAPAGQAAGQTGKGAWGGGQTAALLAKAVKERGVCQRITPFFLCTTHHHAACAHARQFARILSCADCALAHVLGHLCSPVSCCKAGGKGQNVERPACYSMKCSGRPTYDCCRPCKLQRRSRAA